jgi:hypothetical protein
VEIAAIRRCAERGCPYGGQSLQKNTIAALGLEAPSAPAAKRFLVKHIPRASRYGDAI